MDRCQLINGFDLYHDRIFDDEIKTISAVKLDVFVYHWQWLLLLNPESSLS